MNPLYATGYVVGALICARIFYNYAFSLDYKDSVKKGVPTEGERIRLARDYALGVSCAGIVWPLVLIVGVAVHFITLPTPTEKRLAKEKKQREFERQVRAEMLRLHEWHEDNKLESPDTNTLRFMAEENVRNNKNV